MGHTIEFYIVMSCQIHKDILWVKQWSPKIPHLSILLFKLGEVRWCGNGLSLFVMHWYKHIFYSLLKILFSHYYWEPINSKSLEGKENGLFMIITPETSRLFHTYRHWRGDIYIYIYIHTYIYTHTHTHTHMHTYIACTCGLPWWLRQ